MQFRRRYSPTLLVDVSRTDFGSTHTLLSFTYLRANDSSRRRELLIPEMSSKLFDFESIDTHINLNLGIIADPNPKLRSALVTFSFQFLIGKLAKENK